MKKRIPVTVPVCMLLAALAAPWAAVTFLPADAGMAAVLLLFFGADPVLHPDRRSGRKAVGPPVAPAPPFSAPLSSGGLDLFRRREL